MFLTGDLSERQRGTAAPHTLHVMRMHAVRSHENERNLYIGNINIYRLTICRCDPSLATPSTFRLPPTSNTRSTHLYCVRAPDKWRQAKKRLHFTNFHQISPNSSHNHTLANAICLHHFIAHYKYIQYHFQSAQQQLYGFYFPTFFQKKKKEERNENISQKS